jgi:hypothetical protein
MDKIIRHIRSYLQFEGCGRKEIDAGEATRQEVIYNDHKIYYSTFMNPYGDELTIFYSSRSDAERCHSMVFKIREGKATLLPLRRFFDKDGIIDLIEQSKDVTLAAFNYAKQRNGCDFILEDYFKAQTNGHTYNINDVYFICTGQTWFDSFLSIKFYNSNEGWFDDCRENVMKNKWSVISPKLIAARVNLDIVNTEGIDTKEDGSAMKVFDRIRKMDFHIACEFFSKYLRTILISSKIMSVSHIDWVAASAE